MLLASSWLAGPTCKVCTCLGPVDHGVMAAAGTSWSPALARSTYGAWPTLQTCETTALYSTNSAAAHFVYKLSMSCVLGVKSLLSIRPAGLATCGAYHLRHLQCQDVRTMCQVLTGHVQAARLLAWTELRCAVQVLV